MTDFDDPVAPSRSAEPMIEMRKVEKWYGDFHALKNIDLTVAKGEKIVLCGPSGSGKSTLIRCINHLEGVQSGEIIVGGHRLQATASPRSTPCAVWSAWYFSSSTSFRT